MPSVSTDDAAQDLYRRIRQVARAMMAGERANHTLQATALVHEAWMRLGDGELASSGEPQDPEHAMRLLTRAMRRVLVDHARAKGALKRAGDAAQGTVDSESVAAYARQGLDLVEFDDLLCALSQVDEELADLVELRTIGGLSVAEAAQVIGVSIATAERRLKVARAWLARRLPGFKGLAPVRLEE